jgi:acetyltransferase-like isoleucine patch superfamily enzyme
VSLIKEESQVWLTDFELSDLRFAHLGKNVLIDSRALIFNPSSISIGDNCRIDAFSLLSAGLASFSLGNHVHISHSTRIYGSAGIMIHDFVGISSGVAIFTSSDDYSSSVLNNPTVPNAFRNIKSCRVEIGRAAVVGANSVVLPGTSIGLGASVGALSLVNKNIPDGWIVSGNPLRRISVRNISQINLLIDQFQATKKEEI